MNKMYENYKNRLSLAAVTVKYRQPHFYGWQCINMPVRWST